MLSGTNSQDALEELTSDVYKLSPAAKRIVAKETSSVPEGFLDPPETGVAPAGTTVQSAAPASTNGAPGGDGGSPAALAQAAAAALLRERADEGDNGPDDGDQAPAGYFFPYLVLASMWSPWGGQTPSEWKHLLASDGPTNKRKTPPEPAPDAELDDKSPVFNPKAITRLNANGDALSRRQHYAAVKQEKEAEKKAQADKENKAARQEALETRKKGLTVLEQANAYVGELSANIKRIVELREANATAQARAGKIQAIEKKLMLGIGNEEDNKAALVVLLDEC